MMCCLVFLSLGIYIVSVRLYGIEDKCSRIEWEKLVRGKFRDRIMEDCVGYEDYGRYE